MSWDCSLFPLHACIGYPSITANYTAEWKQWWFDNKNDNLYQFMGNVYFHVIYFPSVQLDDARNWTMLHHLSTTGEPIKCAMFYHP